VSIAAGTRLGPYRITELIGKGGMGEVYRAVDARLGRIVAVKVLAESRAGDSQLRKRFELEAKAISSLNHPHICTLHDIGEQDGIMFLVMEFLEGESLSARLKRGPLPRNQALDFGIQIAEALDQAHRRGIVHRDLKPGNMMLTRSGIKLLDFGLAKLKRDLQTATTRVVSTLETSAGAVLGTLPYMAPEQIQGGELDARTDIFSFGAVLYEMVNGKRALDGRGSFSPTESIGVSLQGAAGSSASSALERVIRRCLLEDPEQRWQTALDLGAELRWIRETGAHMGPVAQKSEPAYRKYLQPWIFGMLTLVVMGMLALMLYSPPLDLRETRLDIATPTTYDRASFALSPNGRHLVYAATVDGLTQLWLRPLESERATPLPGTEGGSYPFWSPDSRSVGFFASGLLKRIDINGGAPQTLASATSGTGGTWNREGTILFTPVNGGPLYQVSATGGNATQVTEMSQGEGGHRFPAFLPDGRRFVFVTGQSVMRGALGSADTEFLTSTESSATFLPPRYLVFVRQGALLAQLFDVDDGTLLDDPVTVSPNVLVDVLGAGAFSISASGMIAYRKHAADALEADVQLNWYGRAGEPLGVLGGQASGLAIPAFSPDGSQVVAWRDDDLWLVDTTDSVASQFTFISGFNNYPVWSPNGDRIAFRSRNGSEIKIYEKSVVGGGGEQLLFDSPDIPLDWSPDGRFILCAVVGNQQIDLWIFPTDGGEPRPYLDNPRYTERWGEFSPNGHWVVYESNESGQSEIYVRPFPDRSGEQRRVSLAGGAFPRWRPDGSELYYLAPDQTLMAVPVRAEADSLTLGAPITLFRARVASTQIPVMQYDADPDGRFLITTPAGTDSTPITLIQNWNPENSQ
jgi:serine/threonine protein kinase